MIKEIFNSILMCFNMYTILPLPAADWNKKNMKYILAFFPLVGILEAFLYIFIWKLSLYLNIGIIFRSVLLATLSIIYTGGIHFDGFVDTCDALGSNQSIEKKLEILKDSHIGAYAIIGSIIYSLIFFGAMTEIKNDIQIYIFAIYAIIIRAYSTLSLCLVKTAKEDGLAYNFRKNSNKNAAFILMIIIVIINIFLIYLSLKNIIIIITSFLYFLFHIFMAKKLFSGVSGDLCGHFFTMSNLVAILSIIIVFR